MRLVIVSGLSGSGKSVALHMLEDLDYYCVDNIPAGLLPMFISHTVRSNEPTYGYTAVGVDARNRPAEIASVPRLVAELKKSGVNCEVLFLRADQEALLKRYSETRRRHPLSREGLGLADSLRQERELLEPIADAADLIIDTTRTTVHELRELIRQPAESLLGTRSRRTDRARPRSRRVSGASSDRRQDVRGHRRLPRALDSRADPHQPQLSHDRHRLHRRSASLGLPGRAARAAFLRQVRAGPRASSGRRNDTKRIGPATLRG
jgi:hypothetical protein